MTFKNPSVQERLVLPFGIFMSIVALYEHHGVNTENGLSKLNALLSPHPFLDELDRVCFNRNGAHTTKTHKTLVPKVFSFVFQFRQLGHKTNARGLFVPQPTFDKAWEVIAREAPTVCHFFITLHGLLVSQRRVSPPSDVCASFYDALYDFLDRKHPSFEEELSRKLPHFDEAVTTALDDLTNRHLYEGVSLSL